MSEKQHQITDERLSLINRKEERRRLIDAFVVVIIAILMTLMGGYFDWYENWYVFVHKHEDLELDEIAIGVLSFSILMIWYTWRRQSHANLIKVIALEHEKEASKANQAKSHFLASMSHDLRTPLNAIMGFSDMMRDKAFGPLGNTQYEEYANDIYNSGSLLISLINDILDLSKVEAGKYQLAEETLDISALIHTSTRQLESIAKTYDHTISIMVPTSMPHMLGDERVLIQIFNNLLSNSIKFTPNGGRIKFITKVDENNCVIISISDTGIGISESGISRALKPFEQVDSIESRIDEGTGLGIYLCVNFMKLFGGVLELESCVNEGTTVTLTFPPERTVFL